MKKYFLFVFIIILTATKAYSFDLKTHLWIAQQLLNDIVKNKTITINNKTYELNNKVLSSLINHPAHFRMGTLGIDVFPDPIVGQITAHPGLNNGWKTDTWIQHVLNSATTPAEISFAYGYACHAAMDIFAHTYVNAYSGDIFLLTDEIIVERRHFALEKYIGNHLPDFVTPDGQIITNYSSLISAPSGFLSKTFILNNSVTGEYLKSGSLHLVAMNGVYNVVKEIDNANQNIISTLSSNYLNLLKEEQRLILELDKKVGLTAQAGMQLKLAKEALELKKAANDILLKKIKFERDVIDNGIKTKKDIENIIQQKHQLISNGNQLVNNLENEIIDKRASVVKLTTDIGLLPLTIQHEILEEVSKWIPGIPYPCGTKWCKKWGVKYPCGVKMCSTGSWVKEIIKKTVSIANPAIENLKTTKNKLIDQIANAEKTISNTKSGIVDATNEISKKTEELSNLATNIALAEANELNYKMQEEALEKEIEALQLSYDKASEIYEKTKKEEDELRGRLEAYVDQFINVAKDLIARYNLMHLLLENWKGDIEKACIQYINAGEDFSKDILSNKGNGFSYYADWYKCWSPVFTAIPSEVPQSICTISDYYTKLNSEIDKAMAKLGPLQYLLNPTKALKEKLEKEAKKSMEYAAVQISNHIFGKETTDFFLMVSGRETVTTEKLIAIFKEDGSGKNLLTFKDVTVLINKEMGIANEHKKIDFDQFATLYNALQLSKLSILNAQSLNKLHSDYLGNKKTAYGKTLYPDEDNSNFTILNKAVSSIDGSCQWMQIASPLYRHTGFDQKWPNDRMYSYSYCSDNTYGFRLWVDEPSRESIFKVVFKGPLTPDLYAYATYNNENNRFIPCKENPFPNTVGNNCRILENNTFCNDSDFKRFFKKLFNRY
ncbi:hypothetical protein IM793_22050 [Pedobacter sp. MR2016-19]|uniref:zinc dependent phospholipase C family protein n=1 Tax=Pedobacter sp. MR2016-19 TaxID=2780089 RepID=UPI001873EA09|nr:hypothetical protein [Pedobacter sp. MR2016-19]MBE5321855.1 hypothetical protein [Pedobacter sp. MR2016-19]